MQQLSQMSLIIKPTLFLCITLQNVLNLMIASFFGVFSKSGIDNFRQFLAFGIYSYGNLIIIIALHIIIITILYYYNSSSNVDSNTECFGALNFGKL